MKCPKCGKEIANDSAFCEYCGEPIKKNRKYAIRRTDIRWILLIAMAIASFAMVISFDSATVRNWNQWFQSMCALVPGLVLVIVALVYAIRKLVPWSFMIIMAILAFMNGAMCDGAMDGIQSQNRAYIRVDYHPDVQVYDYSNSLELFSTDYEWVWSGYEEEIPDEKYEEIEKYAEMIAADLRKQGNAVSLDRDVERNYYSYGWVSWLIGEFVVLFVYLIYAFIAYKKKWTF